MISKKIIWLFSLVILVSASAAQAAESFELDRYFANSINLSLNCKLLYTYESFDASNLNSETKTQIRAFANTEAVRAVFIVENDWTAGV